MSINHPSQLSMDFVLYNDFHIILSDVNAKSEVQLKSKDTLIVLGNFESSNSVSFDSKVVVFGNLDVNGNIYSTNPLIVRGNITADNINAKGLIEAVSIKCHNSLSAKNIICRTDIECGGNLTADLITYARDISVGKDMNVDLEAYLSRNLVVAKNIDVSRSLTVGGNIDASHGCIRSEYVSAGTNGIYSGCVKCTKLTGNLKTGKLKKIEPVKMSMAEIKKKLGLNPDDNLIITKD